jgi:hypothetical protein
MVTPTGGPALDYDSDLAHTWARQPVRRPRSGRLLADTRLRALLTFITEPGFGSL